MSGVLIPINQTSDAIIAGKIDGAILPPAALLEFGIGRFATYHYLLGTSVPLLALLMNRNKFDTLPKQSQESFASTAENGRLRVSSNRTVRPTNRRWSS